MDEPNFDITPLMAPYLDVHMVSPLLDFLREIKAYDEKVVTREKIRAVEHTNMIEFVEDEYEHFSGDAELQAEFKAKQAVFTQRKSQIFDIIDHEPEPVQRLSAFFAARDVLDKLIAEGQCRLETLAGHGVTADALEAYYRFSKFKYECGMYVDAEGMLSNYLELVTAICAASLNASTVPALMQTIAGGSSPFTLSSYQGALWGRLACRIVQGKWTEAVADLVAVKESIDVRHVNAVPQDQVRQRAYLLHWSLFVYLNQADGVEALCDLFSERYYLQCVENLCPWLLRYYTVAMVLAPSRRRAGLQDLLHEISSLAYLYSDPMTEFLASLFDTFDFDAAQVKLKDCQRLIRGDFFLQVHADRFMHEARMLICEMYCTVHRTVDLKMLAEKLQFSEEEAEKWTADMVRAGHLQDARIDSFGRQVHIAAPVRPGHKAVVEGAKELTARSAVLAANLEALARDQAFYLQHRLK